MVENLKFSALIPFQNLTVDDVFDLEFQKSLRYFMDISFSISFLIYIFATFVILKKSTKAMGLFKYSLLCQLTFNFGFEIFLFFMNPIFIFPLTIAIFFTHFENMLKNEWILVIMSLAFICMMGGILAFYLALVLRVQVLFEISVSKFFNNYIIFGFYGFSVAFISATGIFPFYKYQGDPTNNLAIVESNIPGLIELFHLVPLGTGFVLAESSKFYKYWFFITVSIYVVIGFVTIIALHILFLWKLNQIKKIVSKQTFALQKMLYKVLLIQMFNAAIFIIFPACLALCGQAFPNMFKKRLANFASPLASLHLIVDVICLLYFVKPYRNFVKSIFWKERRTSVTSLNTSTSALNSGHRS